MCSRGNRSSNCTYFISDVQKIAAREKAVVSLASRPIHALKAALEDPPYSATLDTTRVIIHLYFLS